MEICPEVKVKCLFVVVKETAGVRRPWFLSSRSPRDRDGKRRGADVPARSASHHGGGGTLRNRFVSGRHGAGLNAGSDEDGVDVMKVIDVCIETPRPTHRLLVVSTPRVFCSVSHKFC